jgi:putative protein-disulfide isomerase
MEVVYIADPMCSWCYGFAPVLARLGSELRSGVSLRYVMGGLAPDSDDPMPAEVRQMIQGAWGSIERVTGVKFNRDFWTECAPRRSTYPACRAVLAAESLREGAGAEMFRGIQHAYYQEAQNPSDEAVLLAVGEKISFDRATFQAELRSERTEEELQRHLRERARLGVTVGAAGFPTLALSEEDGRLHLLTAGYCDWSALEPKLRQLGAL